MAEVTKTLFSRELQKNLFPDNAFYKMSKLDGGVEPDVNIVEIPQSGGVPDISVNPTTFPLPISSRTDNKVSYNVDYIASNPTVVNDVNELILSYSKKQDVLEDHAMQLNSVIAEHIGISWCPSTLSVANARQTTGTTSRAANASLGLTGNRKQVTLADLAYMQYMFDNDNIPEQERYALFPASMYNDLVQLDGYLTYTGNDFKDLLAKGFVGEIYGFKVMKRSKAVVYSENAALGSIVKRAYGASLSVTDNEAAIFWHKSFVRRAEGNVKVYINSGVAEYQGDVFSAYLRAGGTAGRTDGKGVGILLQDNA
jgi:hypothetical protein